MKALLCKSPGSITDLVIEDCPTPIPLEDEVLVKVFACGINFPDLLIIQGLYQFKPDLPFSPGAEICGEVTEIGSKVSRFKVGDLVAGGIGWGGMAEFCTCKEHHLSLVKQPLSPTLVASSMVTYGTVYHALKDRATVKPKASVLILGASGGIGVAAIQLAKILDYHVIAASSDNKKMQFCKEQGADDVIGYQNLRKKVKELLDDKGVDIIIDPIGGESSLEHIKALNWTGQYLSIGFASGNIPSIPLNIILLKGIDIKGIFWSRFKEENNQQFLNNQAQIISWLEKGIIKPPVPKVINLEDVIFVLKNMRDRETIGKYVISMV